MSKKLLCFWMIIALLIASISSLADENDTLPIEIDSQFLETTLLGAARLSGYGSDDCWFVASRKGLNNNTLHCFKQKNGKWVESFKNNSILPQNSHPISLAMDIDGIDYGMGETSAPLLCIYQMNATNDYPELTIRFVLEKGIWNLHSVESYTGYEHMLVQDGVATFFESSESLEVAGRVYGTLQRDLRYVSLSSILKTMAEAKASLSNPPKIPAGNLDAQKIKFTGGKKYSVYSGPGENYLRGGNGKAAVSTNDWIQVFGKENGWIMIQYDITSEHMRIGWIKEAALPKKVQVSDLHFDWNSARVLQDVSVTDDPLYTQTSLITIRRDSEVYLLGTMGDWVYIEARSGNQPARGFIPASCLSTSKDYHFASITGADEEKYEWFEVDKLHFNSEHQVTAVSGQFSRLMSDDDGMDYASREGTNYTFTLAPDFHAWMINSMTEGTMEMVYTNDLYHWYINAYLEGREPQGEWQFTSDEPLNDNPDFWFVTTKIVLDAENRISYMEYVYVPWG